MPGRLKDPKRYCRACHSKLRRKRFGKRLEDLAVFGRRRYCDRACMAIGMIQKDVGSQALMSRARVHRKGKCENCGRTKGQRQGEWLHAHHRDGDRKNNSPENIETLCAPCHLKKHWRENNEHCPRHRRVNAAGLEHLLASVDEAARILAGTSVGQRLAEAAKGLNGLGR